MVVLFQWIRSRTHFFSKSLLAICSTRGPQGSLSIASLGGSLRSAAVNASSPQSPRRALNGQSCPKDWVGVSFSVFFVDVRCWLCASVFQTHPASRPWPHASPCSTFSSEGLDCVISGSHMYRGSACMRKLVGVPPMIAERPLTRSSACTNKAKMLKTFWFVICLGFFFYIQEL